MPDLLNVAIGTIFVFVLFSLVVSTLNEVILSFFDQRAKFLRLGLAEMFGQGRSNQPPAPPAEWWNRIIPWFGRGVKNALKFIGHVLGGIWYFGGLRGGGDQHLGEYGTNLLKHGLLNSFSRSDTGGTSPSYIPAGAFVAGLLDVIRVAVPVRAPAAGSSALVSELSKYIDTSHAKLSAAPRPVASALATEIDNAATNVIAAVGGLGAPLPAHPVVASVKARFANAQDRKKAQDAVQNAQPAVAGNAVAISDKQTAIDAITDPAIKAELRALLKDAGASVAAFDQSLDAWFDPAKSMADLATFSATQVKQLLAEGSGVVADNLEHWIEQITEPHLKESLQSLFLSAGRDVEKFKIAVEGWFNGVMDRVSGWYKRFAQKWMIGIAFILAVIVNVDTLAIVRTLSNNPNLAKAVANQAAQTVAEQKLPVTEEARAKSRQERRDAAEAASKEREKIRTTVAGVRLQLIAAQKPLAETRAAVNAANSKDLDQATNQSITDAQKALGDVEKLPAWKDIGGVPKEGAPVDPKASASARLESVEARSKQFAQALEKAVEKADADFSHAVELADPRTEFRSAVDDLRKTGMPIGWDEAALRRIHLQNFKPDLKLIFLGTVKFWTWPASISRLFTWVSENFAVLFPMIAGWALTAIAASLGAPFWFDILSRFVNVRAAGRPPGEKDSTSTPTKPPPATLDTTPGIRPA